jgi:hypothetical protein
MAFPTTSLLDDFNRANEGPPPSSSWAADPLGVSTTAHSVVSNQATSGQHSYWLTSFGADQEAWMTVASVPASVVGLFVRIQSPDTASADAYEVQWKLSGVIEVVQVINSYSSEVSLGTHSGPVPAAGDKIGVDIYGTGATVTLDIYIDDGGAGWALETTFTDSGVNRITSAGYIGFFTGSGADDIDDFGGGARVTGGAVTGAIPYPKGIRRGFGHGIGMRYA